MVRLERTLWVLKEAIVQVMDETPLYTVKEVAKRLRISEESVRRLLRSKQLQGYFIQNEWRISQEHLQTFLNRQLNANQPEP